MSLTTLRLPREAPARVLACGAYLKNTACLLDGDTVHSSPLHDDLSDPGACAALEDSVERLLERARGPIDAVAHDLHPDFHSTRVALALAAQLGVPAVAVQHQHAHIAVVQAEQGLADEPVIGLALDGVGLGEDGTSWGGEVLMVRGGGCERVAHLPALALPGGDVAAREPWRMAASVLHALGRGDEIVSRYGDVVGVATARGVQAMLDRGLNCPRSSGAGRWFDAAAGALGLSVRQGHEAEAAMALEALAATCLAAGLRQAQPERGAEERGDRNTLRTTPSFALGLSKGCASPDEGVSAGLRQAQPERGEEECPPAGPAKVQTRSPLDTPPPFALSLSKGHTSPPFALSQSKGHTPPPFALSLSKGHTPPPFALSLSKGLPEPVEGPAPALADLLPLLGSLFDAPDTAAAAAHFHLALAAAFVAEARRAAHERGACIVALGGGCFINRVLCEAICDGLRAAGLQALRPRTVSCGDAGLALGQAWASALRIASEN
jgi:hydrogenase maturation factor HypF (carbamoyltransferase family)